MNHNIYLTEKRMLHLEGFYLLTGCLLFLYMLSSQSEMQHAYFDLSNGHSPDSVTFLPFWIVLGTLGLSIYLCYELFLIAENGIISPRITRYLTLPIRCRDYHRMKARIFFRKLGLLILILVIMFHLSFLGYKLPLSLWKHSLPELILTCCFLFAAGTLIFIGYLLCDLLCLKHRH